MAISKVVILPQQVKEVIHMTEPSELRQCLQQIRQGIEAVALALESLAKVTVALEKAIEREEF